MVGCFIADYILFIAFKVVNIHEKHYNNFNQPFSQHLYFLSLSEVNETENVAFHITKKPQKKSFLWQKNY